MKTILKVLIVPLLMVCLMTSAQVKTNLNNEELIGNHGRFIKSYKLKVDFQIPAKNIAELLQAEKLKSYKLKDEKPFQLAVAVPVDLDIAKQISWNYDSIFAYGKFTIKLTGALSSSINFDKFDLPQGTEMYIYNENGNMITGPITEKENNLNKIWGSWVYQGPWLVIEIKTPLSTLKQLVLHSNNIAYGYKEIYAKVNGFGTSGPCEINVLCPLGNGWEGERNSVALVLNDNGQDWCSGCMVMNTCSSNRPFFLTANHCFTGQNVTAWRFTFQAWSPTCSPSQNSNGVTYNGSTIRANYANSDFCLVELNNTPPTNSGINYAGWTRSSSPAQNATGIHHPHGDVMKVSKSNSAVVRSGWNGPGSDHWQVFWSPQNNGNGQTVTAVTEGGSSGSPLFDQNHRVVGQLHGGPSACGGSQLWDYYGSFDVSWTGGGTNSTRLSNWLDPNNSGAMTTNTTDIPLLTPVNFSISGDNTVCSTSNNYTIPNLPTGSTVTWSASPSGIATINLPNSLQTTLTKITNGTITLTATISNLCGGNNIVINRQVGVGYTQILNIGYPSSTVAPDELIPMQIFIAPDSLAIGNQKLVIKRTGGGYSNTRYTGGDGAVEFSFPMTGTYTIKVYTYNDCGWSTNYYPLVFFCTNDDMFMLSPNPANTALTVKLNDETAQAGNEKSNAVGIKEIQLTDKMGNVLRRYVYNGTDKQVTMDVSALKADIYYIRVFNGKQWQGKSFIKQ